MIRKIVFFFFFFLSLRHSIGAVINRSERRIIAIIAVAIIFIKLCVFDSTLHRRSPNLLPNGRRPLSRAHPSRLPWRRRGSRRTTGSSRAHPLLPTSNDCCHYYYYHDVRRSTAGVAFFFSFTSARGRIRKRRPPNAPTVPRPDEAGTVRLSLFNRAAFVLPDDGI